MCCSHLFMHMLWLLLLIQRVLCILKASRGWINSTKFFFKRYIQVYPSTKFASFITEGYVDLKNLTSSLSFILEFITPKESHFTVIQIIFIPVIPLLCSLSYQVGKQNVFCHLQSVGRQIGPQGLLMRSLTREFVLSYLT